MSAQKRRSALPAHIERLKLFVEYTLAGVNGTEAVRRLGYSHKGAAVRAHKLANHPWVVAEIEKRRAALFAKVRCNAEYIEDEMFAILRANVADFLTPEGKLILDLDNRAKWKAVKKLRFEKAEDGSTYVKDFELYDKLTAADRLCRLLGAYKNAPPDEDVTDPNETPLRQDARLLLHALTRAVRQAGSEAKASDSTQATKH